MQVHIIAYPAIRTELIASVRALSDVEYQKSLWVNHTAYDGIPYDDLDESVDFLFDNTDLSEDPANYIGEILVDKTEADMIAVLCKKLSNIFEIHGGSLSDEEYISKPEWNDLVEYAKLVLEKLRSNPVKFED